MLIDVVTFDLFGYWIEGVNFGQTETEPYSEEIGSLEYDTINILTNLFSVNLFVLIVLLQGLFFLTIKLTCLRNCTICKRF